MTSNSNSRPFGPTAAGRRGMLTAEPFGRYGRWEGTNWRKSQVVDKSSSATELARVRARLAELAAEQRQLHQALSALESQRAAETAAQAKRPSFENAPVTNTSASDEKVELFRRLFAGRPDVFPVRWENRKTGRAGYSPACFNEWVKGICGKPTVKCGDCKHQRFLPPDVGIIERNLRGGDGHSADFVAGVYPLLRDDTCWFLSADFDKASWAEDASALLETCRAKGVPAALERSRSGNGGHVWIFFAEPVSARVARQLGSALITETMKKRPEIGFASYDRLFPNQDTMPVGGFGNLIAVPLQYFARKDGNSVFLDPDLRPYDDQWAYLSTLPRMPTEAVANIVAAAEASGQVLAVRMPVDDENADEPWKMSPSRRPKAKPAGVVLPDTIKVTIGDQVYIDRTGLPCHDCPTNTGRCIPKPRILSSTGYATAHIWKAPRGVLRRTAPTAHRLASGLL